MLVTVNQTGTIGGVSGTLQQAVSNGFLGTMSVDPNYNYCWINGDDLKGFDCIY
jgi:hypothetical protein